MGGMTWLRGSRPLLTCYLCRKFILHQDDYLSFVNRNKDEAEPRKHAHLKCYLIWKEKKK